MYETHLAVDAMMAMLQRHVFGGNSPDDVVREHVSIIIDAAEELADDYPAGDEAADATLRGYLT